MKQKIRIEKNPWREGVFYVDHILPFTKPLVVKYDKETNTLRVSEEKEIK